MPLSNQCKVTTYITPEEKENLVTLAKKTNLTVSAFIRRSVTGVRLPEARYHKDLEKLLKIAADMARLGNLFKMALDDEDFNILQQEAGLDAVSIATQIHEVRALLKDKILSFNA